jgi:hypothetical protein
MKNELIKVDEANNDYQKALDLLTTSCLKCRFTPDYLGAITLLQKSAETFHGNSKFEEEILCRQRLTFCFRSIKSFWEEGNEYEKIAKIYVNLLKDDKNSLASISNAQIAFKLGKNYDSGLKAIKNMSLIYIEKNNYNYAEKILNIGFGCIKETYHILLLKKKTDDINFIYEIVNYLIECLCFLNDFQKAINDLKDFILLIKNNTQDEKKHLMHFYGSLLILLLCNNEIDDYLNYLNIAKNESESKEDLIYNIEKIYQSIEEKDEQKARKNLKDITLEFSTNVSKQIVNTVNANFKQENLIDTSKNNENDDLK